MKLEMKLDKQYVWIVKWLATENHPSIQLQVTRAKQTLIDGGNSYNHLLDVEA